MDNFPHEAWIRLGKALERRRGQLGYGFRKRRQFAEGKGLSAKTLSRLEHAERDAYPDDTIALAEVIYRWEPGSAEAVLRGGEPVPSPGSPGALRPVRDRSPALERIAGDPELSPELKTAFLKLAGRMAENNGGEENGPERAEG
jgi:transcriptional regulator with XRE-family HTH domain